MKKIAILSSGNGTNAENIYKFFSNGNRVKVELVIYDRRDAPVAARMRALGADTLYLPAEVWTERPDEIVELLRQREIDLVVLAGFLRIVPEAMTSAFAGRMLNIHPSLLPAYGGAGMYGSKVHQAVKEAGETKTGATVHYVDDTVDGGEILMQQEVEVTPDDTPETIEEKVRAAEFSLYPKAIVAALGRQPEAKPGTTAGAQSGPQAGMHPDVQVETQPGEEWAEVLGVQYDPTKLPPAYPGAVPPPLPNSAPGAPNAHGAHSAHGAYSAPNAHTAYSPQTPPAPQEEKMPPAYLVWSVIMTVACCLPAGIVAIIFSSQVSSRYYAGDIEGARRASERAQIWIIVSFVLGVLGGTLYLPVAMLFN